MLKHLSLSVVIDPDACLGEGACVDDAPSTFRLNANGVAVLCPNSTDTIEQIEAAVRNCPGQAISLQR